MKYTKLNDTTLEVETTPIVEQVKTQYTLDQLIAIRASIDVSESEYLAVINSEKAKFDDLIAEAQRLGVKTRDEVSRDTENVESVNGEIIL